MPTIHVTDQTFDNDVLKSNLPVVVDFWAPWCGPCRSIGPILEELATEFEGKVTIAKVNVDENQEIASKLGVMSIPALFAFKDGQVINKKTGASPKPDLQRWIQNII